MNILLQVSLDYVRLAEEVAKIKEPTTNLEIGVWGLLVLSGWVVACVLAWHIYKDKKANDDLWERIITVMTKSTLVLEANKTDHHNILQVTQQEHKDHSEKLTDVLTEIKLLKK